MGNYESLRSTFNSAAEEYDAIRPGYPPALIEDVLALAATPKGGRALEIGCGTGQATLPFAQRGLQILCLDIGPDLLAIAAKKLQNYPQVRFKLKSFEQWPAQVGKFDLIYSATAFHWVPREIGYPKAALALKPGGALAVFANLHPHPYTGFPLEVQDIYARLFPNWQDPANQPSTEEEIAEQEAYIRATGLFSSVTVRTYAWSQTYSTADHLRLLSTYSDHINLEPDSRARLYEALAERIEQRYHGRVERPYLSVLYLAKK